MSERRRNIGLQNYVYNAKFKLQLFGKTYINYNMTKKPNEATNTLMRVYKLQRIVINPIAINLLTCDMLLLVSK